MCSVEKCAVNDDTVGGERTKDAKELLYARQKLVLVAKAFQLQAIDLVHIDYKGLSNFTVTDLHDIQLT